MRPAAWIYSLGGRSKSGELLRGSDAGQLSWESWGKGMRSLGSVLGPSGLRLSRHESTHFMSALDLALICPLQP